MFKTTGLFIRDFLLYERWLLLKDQSFYRVRESYLQRPNFLLCNRGLKRIVEGVAILCPPPPLMSHNLHYATYINTSRLLPGGI